MSTLIAVYNSEGGVAIENTRELASRWVESARAERADFDHAELGEAVAAARLF